MSTSKSVKCKICGKSYVSKQALIDHIEKTHSSTIPEGWNAARYENFLRTGKTEGRCVYCKKSTGWNNTTGKYNRMCGSEKCKKTARDLANKNYIGLHGKPYSINDPEQQKKMVYGRKNSGKYIFRDDDGKEYVAMYDSSYGKDFFEMIDTFLSWDGADIIAPSPHTYWYEYEGRKHFYIPDAYSTSLNLEIEIKDGGDNPNNHPKIQAVDKVKEQKKDAVMESLKGQVNYIKICNKDYSGFFKMLSELKQKDVCQLPKWESKLESITEGYYLCETMDSIMESKAKNNVGLPISPEFIGRQYNLHNPVLNYNSLLEYYRKKLFHENLTPIQWQRLYNELINVREYLKKVTNGKSDEDKRMNYEATKALKQIESFIVYMEEKNSDDIIMETSQGNQIISYLTNGDYDYIKSMVGDYYIGNTMITVTSAFDMSFGLPDNFNKENFDTLIDSVGEKIYKKFWNTHKGFQSKGFTPFGHYQVYTDKKWYTNAYYNCTKGNIKSIFIKPKLYFYNFEKSGRRYSTMIIISGDDIDIYLIYDRGELIRIKQGVRKILESKDVFTSGDFEEYREFADLDSARRPIEEVSRSIDRISFSKEFRYVKEIVDSLSQKDKMYICNGEFKKSPYTKYRNVLMVNNHPVSFIEVYELPQDKGVGYIVVATKRDKRGFGYSKQLVNEFLSSSESRQFDTIAWKYHDGNNVSLKFAQSVGFGNEKDNTLYYQLPQSIIEGNNRTPARNNIPIYIVSWSYSSLVGMGVKVVTRSEYNHTSISLTPNLEECYTFSRNPETINSEKTNGFCKESLSYMVNRYGNPRIKVTAVYVSKEVYDKLNRCIDEYINHQNDTKFDYTNFLYSFLKIPRGTLNDDKLNCSVFVDLILKKSGVDLTNGKKSNLVTPGELSELKDYRGKTLVIYEGDASEYDFAEVSKIVNDSYTNLSYDVMESSFIEATKNDIKYYPVFVFLSYTGTNMARIIKAFTHDPYAHSSLSFDTELNHMVSFNREGMVEENIFSGIYKKNASKIRYSLYVYMATIEEYESMKNFVEQLITRRDKLKYNLLGLTNFIFGRGSEREDKFFCSEFVAATISAGGNKVFKTQPFMISPYMIAKNKNFVFIKTGILKNYESKIIDKIVAEKLEEGGFTNVTIK